MSFSLECLFNLLQCVYIILTLNYITTSIECLLDMPFSQFLTFGQFV